MFQKIKKSIINNPLKTLIIGGLLLRLSLLFLDFSFDVNSYLAWAKEALKFGLPGFYERASQERYGAIFPNYPPLAIFLFILFFQLYQLVFSVAWKINLALPLFPSKVVSFLATRIAMAGFLKIPAVFFDLATVILIFKFVQKIKGKTFFSPLSAAALLLFNPGFFYNSSYLGQIEIIPIFFILLAFYLFFSDKNSFWPLPFLTLALLSKQTAIIFLPLLVFCYLKKRNWSAFFPGFFLSLFLFYLFFLPFLPPKANFFFSPFKLYYQRILLVSGLPFTSNGAYNFWFLLAGGQNRGANLPFFFFSYQLWASFLVSFLLILIFLKLVKKPLTLTSLLPSGALLALTFFLFFTKMHDRHLQSALPFLLLAGLKNKKFFNGFFYFSFIYIVNIYHNWPVPKIVFLESLVRFPLFVNFFIILSLVFYFSLLKNYLFSKS